MWEVGLREPRELFPIVNVTQAVLGLKSDFEFVAMAVQCYQKIRPLGMIEKAGRRCAAREHHGERETYSRGPA